MFVRSVQVKGDRLSAPLQLALGRLELPLDLPRVFGQSEQRPGVALGGAPVRLLLVAHQVVHEPINHESRPGDNEPTPASEWPARAPSSQTRPQTRRREAEPERSNWPIIWAGPWLSAIASASNALSSSPSFSRRE